MSAQSELFAAPVVPGLFYCEAVIGAAEEAALIAAIGAVELTPFRFQGWLGKRRTASFGWQYDFDSAQFAPADPVPDWLLPVRSTAARTVGLAADDLVQVLLTRYDPGAGIGWHRDRPVFEHVIGISLGAPARLRLRRRHAGGFDRAELSLPPRSLYHLSAEARHGWEHSIAPMALTRWSITLRTLSAKAGRAARPL